jgi:hypothetical protein
MRSMSIIQSIPIHDSLVKRGEERREERDGEEESDPNEDCVFVRQCFRLSPPCY